MRHGARLPTRPDRARTVTQRQRRDGRPVLVYDGKVAIFPLVIDPRLWGSTFAGHRLAEIWRETA